MRTALRNVASLAAALTLWSTPSTAQPGGRASSEPSAPVVDAPAPTPVPIVLPPQLKHDEGAVYPAQALREGFTDSVTVDLLLEINSEGRLKKATVETPRGHGFDEAALAAAQSLEFVPASRDGHPVAVRIQYRYLFTPPAARVGGRILDRSSNAPIGQATVTVKLANTVVATAMTGVDGRWRIESVAAGTYQVGVAAAGHLPSISDETLMPGQESDLVYRLDLPPPEDGGAAATDDVDEEEVRVGGERPAREVTSYVLDQSELERIPGTNGDAIRALLNLPGVARPPALAGLLIVRGSAPQDTAIFVDGTPIPIVYHFAGLSSVIPTEVIQKLDFFPGNFGAQYGRAMGGVVDVGLRSPSKDGKFHGLARADFIDLRFQAEGPIAKTGWKFLVAGRRSYFDIWLKPVLQKLGAGVTAAPVYYDYQAMLERKIGHHGSLRLAFFGSDDRLSILVNQENAANPALSGDITTHTGFWRLQARYEDKYSPSTEFHLTTAVGGDVQSFGLGSLFFDVATNPVTGRAEFSHILFQNVRANFGMDIIYLPYSLKINGPAPTPQGSPPNAPLLSGLALSTQNAGAIMQPGIYAEFEINPFQSTRIVPSIRADYSTNAKYLNVAPRLTVRQDLRPEFPKTTVKGGLGIYYQPPQVFDTDPVFGQSGLTSNRAIQYEVGAEQEITRHLQVIVDGYYKSLDHLVETGNYNEGTGVAYGLETLIRYKSDGRFFGWLAYTLSRTTRRDAPGLPIHLFEYDQTHNLTVLGSYRLGRGWEFGARFRIVSGNLYTGNGYGFFDANAGSNLPFQQVPSYGSRLPLFHALDIRVDKRWDFASWKFSMYLDIQNVYNAPNAEAVNYNYNYTQMTYTNGLPILPSLGVRGEL